MSKALNIILFVLTLTFPAHEFQDIIGEFQECLLTPTNNMLQLDENCFLNSNDEQQLIFDGHKYKQDSTFPAFVFSKHNFILETKGFECKMNIKTYYYRTDFLFRKYIQNEIKQVQMTKLECMLMVKEQMCNGKHKMACTFDNDCYFQEDIVEDFPTFFGTIKKDFVECSYHEKIVLAQSHNKSIFHNTKKPCYPNDEVCFFADSTVIWNKDDVRTCPYERLIELPKLHLDNNQENTIFYTDNKEYLFKFVEKITECGLDFYLTSEGLYLSFYDANLRSKIIQIPTSKYEINHFLDRDRNDLLLAESDYTMYKKSLVSTKLACSMFLNTIQMNLDKQDKFLSLNYLGNFFF